MLADLSRLAALVALILAPAALLAPVPSEQPKKGRIMGHIEDCPRCRPAGASPLRCAGARGVAAGVAEEGRGEE